MKGDAASLKPTWQHLAVETIETTDFNETCA